jgi:hypothetical protein
MRENKTEIPTFKICQIASCVFILLIISILSQRGNEYDLGGYPMLQRMIRALQLLRRLTHTLQLLQQVSVQQLL